MIYKIKKITESLIFLETSLGKKKVARFTNLRERDNSVVKTPQLNQEYERQGDYLVKR